jgi:hypothetical protein
MIYQEKIFSKEECEKILSYTNIYTDLVFRSKEPNIDFEKRRIEHITKHTNGKNIGKFFNVWDIRHDEETHWMFEKIIKWFSNVSKIECNPNGWPGGCSLHKYSKGDSFQKHIDLNQTFPDRRWNLGIQLNDSYTGGEYICYDNNDNKIILSKEIGTAIAYNSTTEHEITEILSGERWSIVMPINNKVVLEKKSII